MPCIITSSRCVLFYTPITHPTQRERITNSSIFDIGHVYFPTISERVPDIVVALSLVPLLFIGNPLGVLSYALPPYVVVMVVRAISMLLTTLPAIEDCDKDKKGASSVLGNHCYDLNVSGHYTIVACLVIAYVHFGIVSLPPAIMWMAVAAFGIISARSHYSVDVFLAGILSFSAFKVVY